MYFYPIKSQFTDRYIKFFFIKIMKKRAENIYTIINQQWVLLFLRLTLQQLSDPLLCPQWRSFLWIFFQGKLFPIGNCLLLRFCHPRWCNLILWKRRKIEISLLKIIVLQLLFGKSLINMHARVSLESCIKGWNGNILHIHTHAQTTLY